VTSTSKRSIGAITTSSSSTSRTNYVCILCLTKAGTDRCRFARADDLTAWLALDEASFEASRITPAEWNFAVGRGAGLFEKLQKMPVKLGDIASKLFQGLVTSADDIYFLEPMGKERSGLVAVHSRATEKDYELETAIVKSLCKGSLDARRYAVQPSKRVVFPYDITRTRDAGRATLISPADFKRLYPRTWAYLEENKRALAGRGNGKMRHDGWYGYGYPKSIPLFSLSKILTPSIAAIASFSFDSDGEIFFVGSGGGGGGATALS